MDQKSTLDEAVKSAQFALDKLRKAGIDPAEIRAKNAARIRQAWTNKNAVIIK